MRAGTLRQRVVLALVAVTVSVCVLFSALSFVFVYSVEDEFFAALLANEAAHVTAGGGQPRLPFVKLYREWNEVPSEVRATARPNGREAAGAEGRHYHLRGLSLEGKNAWLVAEVGSLLVVRRMRSTLLAILLPVTAIVLLGSSLVAALVARRSVRQLTDLVDAVERNDLSRLRLTDRELVLLADALDEALGRVHSLLEREKAFVGDVSHELRTPLAVIRGAAELLQRRGLDATASAQIRRIADAARSSEEIIQVLLALAREETAHEETSSIPLLATVEKLVLRHRDLLGSASIDLRVDIAPQTRIVAPRTAAEAVISNLVSNALRHGGGTIEITGSADVVSICDRGRGLDATADRRGIGLDLVRRLCDRCGFLLTMDSSERGTVATVSFEAAPGAKQSRGRL